MYNYTQQSVALTTNSSGAASGTLTNIRGEIVDVFIKLGTVTSTTLTLTNAATGQQILSKSSISSDSTFEPRKTAVLSNGSNLETSSGYNAPASGYSLVNQDLTVALSSGGDTKTATVYVTIKN